MGMGSYELLRRNEKRADGSVFLDTRYHCEMILIALLEALSTP